MKRIFIPLIFLLSVLLSGCGLNSIKGSGNIIEEERSVGGFSKVELSLPGRVILTQGEEESLIVKADDNLMEHIRTEVKDGVLVIKTEPENTMLRSDQEIVFTLSARDVKALTINGAGTIVSEKIESDDLVLNLNGSGKIDLGSVTSKTFDAIINGAGDFIFGEVSTNDASLIVNGAGNIKADTLNAESLNSDINGAGKVIVAGKAASQKLNINGAGNFQLQGLEGGSVTVSIIGAGEAQVWATESLDVTIMGSGAVSYAGSPKVSQQIAGTGKISQK